MDQQKNKNSCVAIILELYYGECWLETKILQSNAETEAQAEVQSTENGKSMAKIFCRNF